MAMITQEAALRGDAALQKALVTNFEPLEKVQVWFVGGAVLNGASGMDYLSLNAIMDYTDGGTEKLTYDLKAEDMKWMTGARKMFEWATGYLAAHLMRTIYRIEHSKENDFKAIDEPLAKGLPDWERKTERGNPYDKG